MTEEIKDIWDEILRAKPNSLCTEAKPYRVNGLKEFDVQLCIDENKNRGILLIDHRSKGELPRLKCANLKISREQLKSNTGTDSYIKIICLEEELLNPFTNLIVSIISFLSSGFTPYLATTEAVEKFRKLLSKFGGILPSEEEILGLVGELLLIHKLVEKDSKLWKGWNGPLGSSRDFIWGNIDIEIKASLLSGEPRITINGLDQLESEEDRCLYLYHSILSTNPSGTISVPILIDKIKRNLQEIEEFDELLSKAGYVDEQRDLWIEHRFTLHESSMYKVTDEFPRIKKSDFPNNILPIGVSKIRFDVLLSNASKLKVTEEGVVDLLKMMK